MVPEFESLLITGATSKRISLLFCTLPALPNNPNTGGGADL